MTPSLSGVVNLLHIQEVDDSLTKTGRDPNIFKLAALVGWEEYNTHSMHKTSYQQYNKQEVHASQSLWLL